MKLLINLIEHLSAAIFAEGSSAPTYSAADGTYEWAQEVKMPVPALDTLVATDSTVFINKFRFDAGWQYIWVHGKSTGTAADSVKVALRVDYFDANKTFLYSVFPDTIASSAGQAVMLPIGRTGYAAYMSLTGKTFTGQGTQVILPLGYANVIKRRPVVVTKKWE